MQHYATTFKLDTCKSKVCYIINEESVKKYKKKEENEKKHGRKEENLKKKEKKKEWKNEGLVKCYLEFILIAEASFIDYKKNTSQQTYS